MTLIERIIADADETGEPWVLTQHGVRVAVLVSADVWEQLIETLATYEQAAAAGSPETGSQQ